MLANEERLDVTWFKCTPIFSRAQQITEREHMRQTRSPQLAKQATKNNLGGEKKTESFSFHLLNLSNPLAGKGSQACLFVIVSNPNMGGLIAKLACMQIWVQLVFTAGGQNASVTTKVFNPTCCNLCVGFWFERVQSCCKEQRPDMRVCSATLCWWLLEQSPSHAPFFYLFF